MLYLIFSLFFLFAEGLTAKQIALSFDDCPMSDGPYYTGLQRTRLLTKKLKRQNVQGVAFFCNTHNLDKTGKRRLQKYAANGHVIANHTASHPDLHQTNVQDYIANIEAAHELLKGFPNFKKWFRFPYLREGETVAKRDAVRKYLSDAGYLNGYVTVDNYDWYMNSLFRKALAAGKKVDFSKLKEIYVRVLTDDVDFYDSIAQRVLKRSPKHILLLHENDLAALFIDGLIKKLRANGWTIISAESAYQDRIATELPDTLLLGQGRVVALASAAGDVGPFWKWEEDEEELDRLFETEGVFE